MLQHEFARILLDVQMPGMNGFEAAQLIKSRERSRYIPIIFLTAINKEDAYVFEGYSMGAVDYVFKPFNPDVLRSKVAVFVDLYLKQQQTDGAGRAACESQRRELELEHRAELLEAEAKSAAQLTELNAKLKERQDELEQAMGVRSRFYASMSHELRTPINAVIGYSTLMIDNIYGPLNDKQREGSQRTLRAARHLLELVNDVLDLSKIEAGKIELALPPVNMANADRRSVRHGAAARGRARNELTFEQSGRQHHDCDRSAARAADSPQPSLERDQVRQAEADQWCRALEEDGGVSISVIDQGEGISDEDQHRIFEEFVQVSPQPADGDRDWACRFRAGLRPFSTGRSRFTSMPQKGEHLHPYLPADGAKVYDPDENEDPFATAAPDRRIRLRKRPRPCVRRGSRIPKCPEGVQVA